MLKLFWPDRVYARLLHYARQGRWQYLLACQAAGWLSLCRITPSLMGPAAPTGREIALSAVLLGVLLLGIGPLLNLLQPALRQAGRLPAELWLVAVLPIVLYWRHRTGQQLLDALAAQTSVPERKTT